MNVYNLGGILAATITIGFVQPGVARAATYQTADATAAQSGVAAQVVVNGSPIQFQGQPPIEQNGHLLVPLRGVLEKLGAYVDFDSAKQTVVAFRGQTRITLPIGSTTAQVNGQPVSLDVAAQVVNGSTLVPLRFVAESLGAQVTFDVNTNTVSIAARNSEPPPPQPEPNFGGVVRHDQEDAQRRAKREADARRAEEVKQRAEARARALADEQRRLATQNAVVGTVVALYTDVNPARLVIHVPAVNGAPESDRAIPVPGNVPVIVQRPNAPAQPIPLTHINEGDLVSVLQNGDGNGTAINIIAPPPGAPNFGNKPWVPGVFRGEFFGRAEHNDAFSLRMVDGRVIDVPRNVPVIYHNHPVRPEDLRPGDRLKIVVDPKSHRGIRVEVNAEL